jgi:hypothetical protein
MVPPARKNDFWQFNIGHVITIVTLVTTLISFWTNTVSEFSSQRSDVASLKQDVATLAGSVSAMQTWKDQQAAENTAWKLQITQSFDTINRHLERLDYSVSQVQAPTPPRPRK